MNSYPNHDLFGDLLIFPFFMVGYLLDNSHYSDIETIEHMNLILSPSGLGSGSSRTNLVENRLL